MSICRIELDDIAPYIRYVNYVDTTDAVFGMPRRMIYDYEVYYVMEGEITVVTDDEIVTLRAGDFHVMRPFIYHERQAVSRVVRYYNLHFDFVKTADSEALSIFDEYVVHLVSKGVNANEYASRDTVEPARIALPIKKHADQAKAGFLMQNMLEHYRMPRLVNQLLLKSDFFALLAMLENNDAADESCHYNVLAQFTQALADGGEQRIFLSDLAVQNGRSPWHMRKMFKLVNHISAKDYLIEKRIERAKFLLEEGKLSITDISQKVGYQNYSYFSRFFRKKTGMCPSEYRKTVYKSKTKENESG